MFTSVSSALLRKYHTHKRLKELLAALVAEFPDIAELYSIGQSVQVILVFACLIAGLFVV